MSVLFCHFGPKLTMKLFYWEYIMNLSSQLDI